MSNKQIETLDEVLATDKDLQKELKKENKSKKRGLIVIIAAVLAAIGVAASTIVIAFFGKKNENKGTNNSTSNSSTFDLDDMGNELEIPTTTTIKFGNVVSGTVDLDKVVEQNGKLYANESEASKTKTKITTSINLKNDTLKTSVVKGNGTTTVKVYDKTTGYIIKDETGKTVATGNLNESGIPDKFEQNEDLKGTFEKEDNTAGLVYSDSNYYNEEGKLVIEKGSVVSKETLEYAKKYLSTTPTSVKNNSTTTTTTVKPSTTTTKPSTTTTITKKNTTTTTTKTNTTTQTGTYTDSYGNVWISYQDYLNGMLDLDGIYTEADGILRYNATINQNTQKTLVK